MAGKCNSACLYESWFYIDDPEAEILGTYCELGLPAYGLKEMDGWTSVYCAPQILRSELLASPGGVCRMPSFTIRMMMCFMPIRIL